MAIGLHNLKSVKTKSKKRLGRGNSSGTGTYAGRGQKGQRSRSGGKGGLKRLGVKGYLLRIPKSRGFKSLNAGFEVVSLENIAKLTKDNKKINLRVLNKAGLITNNKKVKVLGEAQLEKSVEIIVHAFSKTAQAAIEKAGAKATLIKAIEKPGAKKKPQGDKK